MQESLLKSKRQISKTKLNSLRKNIQPTKLLKTLEAELTTKDRVLSPFWNNYSKAVSKKLWCPQVIDFHDSVRNSSLGYLNSSEQGLQSSIGNALNPLRKNYQATSWKLLRSSQPDTTGVDHIRSRKIRIYPTREQKILFDKCFKTHRYFYNLSVNYTKNINIKNTTSNITIRKNIPIGNDELKYPWMKEVPYDTRQLAIKNFTGSYKSSLALLKNGHIRRFELKYLSKKDRSDIFFVNKKALTKDFKLFQRKLKISNLSMRKKAKKAYQKSDGDFPIIRDKAGRYYLCIVQKYNNSSKNINSKDSIVALDPGVRTFMTYFSEKEFGTVGDKFNIELRSINNKIDKLEGLKAKSKAKTRYAMKRRCLSSRSKITNKVNDLHWKTAAFLTKRYKVILLPIFKSKQMSMKNPNRKVNREMYNLAHYKFKERVKYKASLNNCQVIDCCESYTSKTCTKCGELNNVGSKKIYKCSKCDCHIDRDLNGARNVFIRSLTKYYSG